MKILIPVIGFGKEGGYRTLSRMATEWQHLGHEVYFVASFTSEPPYYPTKATVIYVDKKGECCQPQKVNLSIISEIFSIVKFLNKNSYYYDVVLANQNITSYAAKFGSKSNNFYYIQAYEPEFFEGYKLKSIISRIVATFSYHLGLIQIVNADIYKNYKNLHSEYVVPPGIDLKIFHPKEKQWDGSKPITVGCIGRTEEWKGSRDVANAIKIVRSRGETVHFKVAFNPVDCEDYELVKPDGDENLSAFYRSLDILVAPAKLQLGAIHYPVLEAMASGTTLITTGYYPATDENSYIVPISSPEKIADSIIDIIHDRDTALKKTNLAIGEIQRFAWEKVSSTMLDIFDENIRRGNK